MTWRGTPGPWKADRVFGCKRITAKSRYPGQRHRQARRIELACTSGIGMGDEGDAEDQANADGMAAVPQMVAALLEVRTYLDGRADAECDASGPGYTGNDEMRLLVEVDAALSAARVKP